MDYNILEIFRKNRKRGYSENTLEAYERSVRVFMDFVNKELTEIKKRDVQNWLFSLREAGNETSTVNQRYYALKTFFEYLTYEGYISKNPIVKLEVAKKIVRIPKYLDKETMHKLRFVMKNIKHKAIFETLYSTGVRVSELININKDDIKCWNQKTIWIKEGKGTKERMVLFSSDCKVLLEEYLKTRKDNEPYLFVNTLNKRLTRQGIWKMFKKYAKKAGLSHYISPHCLRHTFATDLAEKGVKDEIIAEFLGLDDLNNVEIYAQLTDNARTRNYNEYVNK